MPALVYDPEQHYQEVRRKWFDISITHGDGRREVLRGGAGRNPRNSRPAIAEAGLYARVPRRTRPNTRAAQVCLRYWSARSASYNRPPSQPRGAAASSGSE